MNKRYVRRDLDYCVEIDCIGGEDYEYEMISVNTIPGFLPVQVERINGREILLYTYTGDKLFEDKFSQMWINGSMLYDIVDSVLSAMEYAGEYLLNPDNLVLLKDSLFWEEREKSVKFFYVPGYEKDITEQFRGLMDYLSEKIDKNDAKGVMLAWKLHMILKEPRVSIKAVKECLKEYKEEEKEPFSMETKQGQKKEKKSRKNRKSVWLYLLLLFCGLGFLFVGIEIYILFHIYFYGIAEWKRNLLVWNSGLLAVIIGMAVFFFKKERARRQVDKLFSLK